MSDLLDGGAGARRAAETLLKAAGGRMVLLRVPAGAVAADDAEQLGLATPQFQDLELGPVVFRKVRARVAEGAGVLREMLVSAAAVERLLGSVETDGNRAARVLFADAAGVLVDGVLMEVASVTAAEAFGAVYLYRVVLREPVRLAI